MYDSTKKKAWIYNRVMEICKEKVWKPYVENSEYSVLLLDQLKSQIHSNFIYSMKLIGTSVIEIPGGLPSLSEPSDLGIMKQFKAGFVDLCQEWKVAKKARFGGTEKIRSLVASRYSNFFTQHGKVSI